MPATNPLSPWLFARLAAVALLLAASPAAAQLTSPTAFTYQGRLLQNGQPYTGTADVQFTLIRGSSLTLSPPPIIRPVDVADGTFTTTLDFGPELTTYSFNFGAGDPISANLPSLEISVRTPAGSANPFVPLLPRQTLSPTPSALGLLGFSRFNAFTTDVGQPLEDTTFQINANVVQTLVPTRPGDVESVVIKFTNTGAAAPVTLTLRLNSLLIGTSTATVPPGGGLVRFNFPVGTNVGTTAALRLDFNTTTSVGVRYASSNPYAAGAANFLAAADIVFFLNLRDSGSWLSSAPIEIRSASASALAAASTSSQGAAFLLAALGTNGLTFSLTSTAIAAPEGPGLLRIRPTSGGTPIGLTMTPSGQVGVNKLTPSADLHVGGSLAVDGAIALPATTRQYNVPAAACSTIGTTGGLSVSASGSVTGGAAGQVVTLTAPINLPQGAVITKLRTSILDNTTDDVSISLISANMSSATSSILRSATTAGALNAVVVTTLDLSPLPPPVDNATRFYFIRATWTTPTTPGNIAVRSLGVEYTVTSPLP